MGNPQHLDWLLEGVDAWNKRRADQPFEPDLSELDVREAFNAAGKLTNDGRIPLMQADLRWANLEGAVLRRADLWGAVLREAVLLEADLLRATLQGANLEGAVLRRADLWEAILEGADLQRADLWEAKLRGADLREADLEEAVLLGADLREADLRGAVLRRTNLWGAYLEGANVRTIVNWAAGTNDVGAAEFTDLSTTKCTQDQFDKVQGDTGTILPPDLTRPAHWPDWEGEQNSDQERERDEPTNRKVQPQRVLATRLRSNTEAVELSAQAMLAQIDEEYERLRGNNFLADQQPEYHASAMQFLDTLRTNLTAFASTVPKVVQTDPETPEEEAAVSETQGTYQNFIDGVREGCDEYFDGKRIGKSLVPVSIILGAGALGALVTGGNPLGFGAGMLAGKFFTGELKAGKAGDELKKTLETPDPEQSDP